MCSYHYFVDRQLTMFLFFITMNFHFLLFLQFQSFSFCFLLLLFISHLFICEFRRNYVEKKPSILLIAIAGLKMTKWYQQKQKQNRKPQLKDYTINSRVKEIFLSYSTVIKCKTNSIKTGVRILCLQNVCVKFIHTEELYYHVLHL